MKKLDIDDVLDNIKELIECSRLTPDEVKRALTREMNLKIATTQSAKKKRMTQRAKFEKEIKEAIKLHTSITGYPSPNFVYEVNNILRYVESNLSKTSFWRLKTNIANWLHEKYSENANALAHTLHLFEYYTSLYRKLREDI